MSDQNKNAPVGNDQELDALVNSLNALIEKRNAKSEAVENANARLEIYEKHFPFYKGEDLHGLDASLNFHWDSHRRFEKSLSSLRERYSLLEREHSKLKRFCEESQATVVDLEKRLDVYEKYFPGYGEKDLTDLDTALRLGLDVNRHAEEQLSELKPQYETLEKEFSRERELREELEKKNQVRIDKEKYFTSPLYERHPPRLIADGESETVEFVESEEISPNYYANYYKGVKLDPYRVAKIYNLQGGPREQIMKKCLRGMDKGDSEREVIRQIRQALDRWEEMVNEDENNA